MSTLIGQRFGRLLVLREGPRPSRAQRVWVCKCSCGTIKMVRQQHLRHGRTQSCGCLSADMTGDRFRTHGLRSSRTYRIWVGMKQRCQNHNNPKFPSYGGRGITVCNRWQSFQHFFADMGHAPPGKSIERKNNSLGYLPSNCIWATPRDQSNNGRHNVFLSADGKTLTMAQWARQQNLNEATLRRRINVLGWDIYTAIFTPTRVALSKK